MNSLQNTTLSSIQSSHEIWLLVHIFGFDSRAQKCASMPQNVASLGTKPTRNSQSRNDSETTPLDRPTPVRHHRVVAGLRRHRTDGRHDRRGDHIMARQTVASLDARISNIEHALGAIMRHIGADESASPAPQASVTPATPKRSAKPDHAETCTAIRRNGRRCRQTVWNAKDGDMGPLRDGRCVYHANREVFTADANDEVVVDVAPKPAAKRDAKPKASSGETCRGHVKSGARCKRSLFLDENGYCQTHASQASQAKPKASRTVKVAPKVGAAVAPAALHADDV